MARLDPTLDVVFKLLLLNEPRLLADMLEGILARPVGTPNVTDSTIAGDRVGDKSVIFDVHAALEDGTRADIEMQRRTPSDLAPRLLYYAARDYAVQLRRGDSYYSLSPTNVIVWLTEPLLPTPKRLHSIFELRERSTNDPFGAAGDHLTIHVLQLCYLSPSGAIGYAGKVERWARFFTARSDAELCQLASEDPIMSLAKQTLDRLSEDPDAQFMAQRRDDEIELNKRLRIHERVAYVAEFLLKQLELRFGPLTEETRRRVMRATPEQLEAWGQRFATAQALDEVFVYVPPAPRNAPHWLSLERRPEPTEQEIREAFAEYDRAQADLLLGLLAFRFGPVSQATRARVEAGSPYQVERWGERVLTARTLDEVLGP